MDRNQSEELLQKKDEFLHENIDIKTETLEETEEDSEIQYESSEESINGTTCIHDKKCSDGYVNSKIMHNQFITVQELDYLNDMCSDLEFREFKLNQKISLGSKQLLSVVRDLDKSETEQDFETNKQLHTDERPIQCNFCSKSFTHSSHLKNHERSHEKEASHSCINDLERISYECEICSKTFSDSSDLKVHEKEASHSSTNDLERISYECEICSKTFSDSSALKAHSIIHTDQNSYESEICSKSFSNRFLLDAHLEGSKEPMLSQVSPDDSFKHPKKRKRRNKEVEKLKEKVKKFRRSKPSSRAKGVKRSVFRKRCVKNRAIIAWSKAAIPPVEVIAGPSSAEAPVHLLQENVDEHQEARTATPPPAPARTPILSDIPPAYVIPSPTREATVEIPLSESESEDEDFMHYASYIQSLREELRKKRQLQSECASRRSAWIVEVADILAQKRELDERLSRIEENLQKEDTLEIEIEAYLEKHRRRVRRWIDMFSDILTNV